MKKKNEKNNDNENKKCPHHTCKFCYAFFTIILIVLCAVGEHFFNKNNLSKISKDSKTEALHVIEENKKDYDLNISKLKSDISSLEAEMSKFATKEGESVCTFCKKLDFRKKWKTWIALKEKMEASELFDKELEDFNKLFSYDKELIAIVNDLAKGVDIISTVKTEKESFINTCKRFFRKIIRIKKIDYCKLMEVSGYVLSSIEECD